MMRYGTLSVLLLALCCAPVHASAPRHFVAVLDQANEVPPTGSQTTGVVDVFLQYSTGGVATSLDFRAKISNGVQLRQLHFHCAPVGVNGPVIAFMAGRHDGGVNVDKGLWVRGNLTDQAIVAPVTCATAAGPGTGAVIATIDDLAQQAQEGNIYICAHDAEFPGGATRGQLLHSGHDR